MQWVMRWSPRRLRLFTGDELRTLDPADLAERARGTATVALGATGCSNLVGTFDHRRVRRVIDPPDSVLECFLAHVKEVT